MLASSKVDGLIMGADGQLIFRQGARTEVLRIAGYSSRSIGDFIMRALMRGDRKWTGGDRTRRLLALLGIVALAVSAQARAETLEDIRFSSLPNDVTQIELRFDSPPPSPSGYTIDQPARIAIDLEGATSALESRYHSLGTGNARSVTVVEAGERLRVIVNLTQLVPYETRVRGNSLFLDVGAMATESGPGTEPVASVRNRSTESGPFDIRDIDFRRGPEGEGQVIVKLSNAAAPVDVLSEAGSIRTSRWVRQVCRRRCADVSTCPISRLRWRRWRPSSNPGVRSSRSARRASTNIWPFRSMTR